MFKVVWHGLENESIAKSLSQSILDFRVEKTCKALNKLGVHREVIVTVTKSLIDTNNENKTP